MFSVIIAIYNSGRYLDDSISSLINQTIGLRKIQIILINDGSTDETEEICLKYKKEYKQNISEIKINNRNFDNLYRVILTKYINLKKIIFLN